MANTPKIRELFIEELAQVKGGSDGNPVKEEELYDLAADPYELDSLHDRPASSAVMSPYSPRRILLLLLMLSTDSQR